MIARVLIVDDHAPSAELLAEALRDEGYLSRAVGDAEAAIVAVRAGEVDVLVTDLRMDGMDGIALLRAARAIDPCLPVLLVTAHATLPRAIEATRAGAFAFLTKPLKLPELLVQVRNAAEQARLMGAARAGHADPGGPIIGGAPALLRALGIADRAALSDATALITGESGTGKELFARRIHSRGARSSRPFIAVNCGAIPESLIESELFGHARGAFTGATVDRPGIIEAAHQGTLFLDEVGELSPAAQTRLLRFLQEGTVRRVGDQRDRQVDARVIAATHRDLRGGDFRDDLFYRLHVLPIALPPLRARAEDVPPLLGAALRAACARMSREMPVVSSEAMGALLAYRWPGNVRELINLAERLAVLTVGDAVTLSELPPEIAEAERGTTRIDLPPGDFDLTSFLESIEERALRRALARCDGVKAQASASLGLERNAFRYKLKKYGIEG